MKYNEENLKKIILENKDEITGISVNNYFYNVDYIADYNVEFEDEPIVHAYEIEYKDNYRSMVETYFDMEELLNADLVFYKHTKI